MAREVEGLGAKAEHIRLFLKVTEQDFSRLRHGAQTEVRQTGNIISPKWPRPVIVWTVRGLMKPPPHALMVLEKHWREPLGAISPESIRAYGCTDMDDFRQNWCYRNRRRGFPPTAYANCFQLRRWEPDDTRNFADSIFDDLYGPFVPQQG